METRLTEFSYGYCVTEEFANGMGAGLKAAPYFPLYIEGKAGGGLDVRIGSALFLQFKLCHELTRATARECQMGLLSTPFFRYSLHRRDQSDQHKMLIELEQQPGNQVYYIAHGFADVGELNRHYTSGRVIAKSALFSPSDIGPLPDNEPHRISFRPGENRGWFLSEPKQLRHHPRELVVNRAMEGLRSVKGQGVRDWLTKLTEQMSAIIGENRGRYWNQNDATTPAQLRSRDPLDRAAYLARTYFGAELFIAADPRNGG